MSRPIDLPPALDATRKTLEHRRLKTISYYVGGPEDAPPLVLIHSINAAPSAFEMKPLFDQYRATRRVYVPELPGFGFSDRSDRAYSPELYAESINAFLKEVVGQPVDLVAFSLSSEFAARAVLNAPSQFSSLVLLSPTGFSKRRLPSGETGKLHRFFPLPGVTKGLYKLLTSRRSIRFFLQLSYVTTPPDELIDYAYATAHQPGARHAPYRFLSGQLFSAEAHSNLYAKLELPVLVIHDRDANVTFEALPEVVEGHDNWEVALVQPTLGIPQWERPAETCAAIDAFWQRQFH